MAGCQTPPCSGQSRRTLRPSDPQTLRPFSFHTCLALASGGRGQCCEEHGLPVASSPCPNVGTFRAGSCRLHLRAVPRTVGGDVPSTRRSFYWASSGGSEPPTLLRVIWMFQKSSSFMRINWQLSAASPAIAGKGPWWTHTARLGDALTPLLTGCRVPSSWPRCV